MSEPTTIPNPASPAVSTGTPVSNPRAAFAVTATAAAYWAVGFGSLSLAIPPGYSTPIWPAAGVALALTLVWGWRALIGVFIGSFLIHVGTSFDASTHAALLRSISIPFWIGIGAALQAWAGAALIRRGKKWPHSMSGPREIARFMALGGFVACLIAATVGNLTLAMTGIVPGGNILLSWFAWWVGDATGTILVAPVLALWVGPARETSTRRRWMITLPTLALMSVVVLIYVFARMIEDARIRYELHHQTLNLAQSIHTELTYHEQAISSIVSFYASSEKVGRGEFSKFVNPLVLLHRGDIQAFAWLPRVRATDRGIFEATARADGLTDYRFTERESGGEIVTRRDADEYYPVSYVEPIRGNETALGFDVASEEKRREAMKRACDEAKPAVTEPIRLLPHGDRNPSQNAGIILFMPVYRNGPTPQTVDDRRANLTGFVIAVVDIQNAFNKLFSKISMEGISLRIMDADADTDCRTMYEIGIDPAEIYTSQTVIPASTRRWTISCSLESAFLARRRPFAAWATLTGGTLMTALLSVLFLTITGREKAIAAQVKHRTEALRATERRFRTVVDTAPNAIVLVDTRRLIRLVNRQACVLFGYTKDELIGRHVELLVPKRHRAHHPDQAAGWFQNPEARPLGAGRDISALRKDGQEIPVEIALTPLTMPEGLYALASVIDITERRRSENKLRLNRERLETFLDLSRRSPGMDERSLVEAGLEAAVHITGSAIGYFHFVDEDSGVIRLSAWFGGKMESDSPATPRTYTMDQAGAWTECLRTRAPIVDNDHRSTPGHEDYPEGRTQIVRHASVPIFDDDRIRMILGVANKPGPYDEDTLRELEAMGKDVWALIRRRRTEEALREAKSAAEAANISKGHFLSMVSHELRTPLTSIRGSLRLLASGVTGELPEEARELVTIGSQDSERLARLINNVLDFQKIESGRMEIKTEDVELSEIIATSIRPIAQMAAEKNVAIDFDGAVTRVKANRDAVIQVITNLLSNALKFSPEKSRIRVKAGPAPEERSAKPATMVSVTDPGPGIPDEFRSRIFSPFEQARGPGGRARGGTGLGLSICKALVERMHGQIWFDSEVGRGTTFFFTLPSA